MSTRPKPGVNRLVETAIYVDDIARASEFYDTVFGFPALVRDNRVVAYDARGFYHIPAVQAGRDPQ
ncbi:VOC family protein [uncultured Devosia sp.]|uniref:VOC family protein n=1 Tax=uncultured Devosia sp. TaxID=211434 RepID=UPI003422755E